MILRKLLPLLVLGIALETASADEVHLADSSVLADGSAWTTHNNSFRPAQGAALAELTMPPGTWSALMLPLPVDSGKIPRVTLTAKVRLVGDFSELKPTVVQLQFRDGPKSAIKDAGKQERVRANANWQTISLTADVPSNAIEVVAQISSRGGGALEIEDLEVTAPGFSLAAAAARGVRLKDTQVPGSPVKLEARDDLAEAAVVNEVPMDFDAPIWQELPRYAIPVRSAEAGDAAAASASFQIAADAEALVVRLHAKDPTLNFTFDPAYRSDSFEFFLLVTGAAGPEFGVLRQEQFTISRKNDETIYEERGGSLDRVESRVVEDGWEALLRIPMRTNARGIPLFDGFAMTFNVGYHDANTQPQEYWLSFSPDDTDAQSWRNPALYRPLVLRMEETADYEPVWIAGESAYDVTPTHAGQINLVRPVQSLDDIAFWRPIHEVEVTVGDSDEGPVLTMDFPADDGVKFNPANLMLSPFSVMAGEEVELLFDARASREVGGPRAMFLTQMNWQQFAAEPDRRRITTEWEPFRYTFKLPSHIQASNRNGRILLNFGTPRGVEIAVRDVRVLRRTPHPVDAVIRVDGLYSHFWTGEDNALQFDVRSERETPGEVRVDAKIRKHFGGETVLEQTWTRELDTDGFTQSWDVSALPKGYFDVILTISDAEGQILAARELRVSKSTRIPDDEANPHAGLWYHDAETVAPPIDWDEHIAFLRGLGISLVQFNHVYFTDHYGKFIPSASSEPFRLFKDAGLVVGSGLRQYRPATRELWRSLDELDAYARPILRELRGLVDAWNFANEPNLPGGWSPVPDGREWAMFYRAFDNLVREEDPESEVLLGSYNRVPLEYMEQVFAQNGLYFSDPLIGVHLYRFNADGDAFEDLLSRRQTLESMYPGWKIWDNESGIVFSDFATVVNLQAKKLPIILSAGLENTFFYNDRDLIFPLGDSSPLVPMEAARNAFLRDVRPVGKVTLGDGQVYAFLFEREGNTPLAVFWNTRDGAITFEMPFGEGGAIHDMFGETLERPDAGNHSMTLEGRFVHYAEGVDLAALKSREGFTPAFTPSQPEPKVGDTMATQVFLTMTPMTGQFDRELVEGEAQPLRLRIDNASDETQTVSFSNASIDGLNVAFAEPSVTLEARSHTEIEVRLTAGAKLDPQPLALTGSLANGKPLVPITLNVRTAPAITTTGHSRAIVVRNNTTEPQDVTLNLSRGLHRFRDAAPRVENLGPRESRTIPIAMRPNDKKALMRNNHWNAYVINSSWGDTTAEQRGEVFMFTLEAEESDRTIDPKNLPYTAQPDTPGAEDFSVKFGVYREGAFLRIVARVKDPSPVQRESRGDLKLGGDCMIVAVDRDPQQLEAEYGDGDFECGFAIGPDGPTSYVWDGTYGLESAKPFDDAVNRIAREGDFVIYDVRIPLASIFAEGSDSAGLSIAFVNETAEGDRSIIHLGRGIFPERDASAFGLLLDMETMQ